MKSDFEQWLTAQFADTGPFTVFIVLVRIADGEVAPLKSSYAHLIGDEMAWPEMRGLLDGAGTPWVVDFDRGRIREAGAWRERVLERLGRSLARVSGGSSSTPIRPIQVVAFSEMFADLLGYERPAGTHWVAPVLGTFVFAYGGRPFLVGAARALLLGGQTDPAVDL